jgi:hypothetical protein
MMRVMLTIEDSTFDMFVKRAEELQARGALPVKIEDLMSEILAKFAHINPGDRPMVIGPAIRGKLEEILCGGHLMNEADLLAKVSRLARIDFGPIRLDFTPGQLEELKHFADRQGKSVEYIIKDTVRTIQEQLFWRVGV